MRFARVKRFGFAKRRVEISRTRVWGERNSVKRTRIRDLVTSDGGTRVPLRAAWRATDATEVTLIGAERDTGAIQTGIPIGTR